MPSDTTEKPEELQQAQAPEPMHQFKTMAGETLQITEARMELFRNGASGLTFENETVCIGMGMSSWRDCTFKDCLLVVFHHCNPDIQDCTMVGCDIAIADGTSSTVVRWLVELVNSGAQDEVGILLGFTE